jgi:hypothetical protein
LGASGGEIPPGDSTFASDAFGASLTGRGFGVEELKPEVGDGMKG